jgi:aspartate/methionine/tyrosine aminotransferase
MSPGVPATVVFSDIAYLSWIDGRPDAVAHDLASSDLRPAEPTHGPVPRPLADLTDPPGEPALDALLADSYGVDPENVLVTAGASNANALAFAVAANPSEHALGDRSDGDQTTPRILVEKPGYEPMLATPRGFGAHVDRFRRPEGILDPARVDAAVTDATTLVAITDRHNPTGRRTQRDALEQTAENVHDTDARLLVDEVYAPFTTTPTDGPFGAPSLAGTDGVVVTGSLTKFLGLGGLRIGWLVADEPFVQAAERVQRHFPSVAEPSVALARRALHHRDILAARSRDRITRNTDLLADFAADHTDLAGHIHDGATFCLLTHDDVDGDTLTDHALREDVLVVPGRFFDRPDAVRLSLGRPTQQATAALDALDTVLDDLST